MQTRTRTSGTKQSAPSRALRISQRRTPTPSPSDGCAASSLKKKAKKRAGIASFFSEEKNCDACLHAFYAINAGEEGNGSFSHPNLGTDRQPESREEVLLMDSIARIRAHAVTSTLSVELPAGIAVLLVAHVHISGSLEGWLMNPLRNSLEKASANGESMHL